MSSLPSPLRDLYIRFPGLAQFADAYLIMLDYHYGTVEAAVDEFIEDEPALLESALAGVTHILTAVPEEGRVEALRGVRFPFVPPDDAELDSFLKEIQSRLAAAL